LYSIASLFETDVNGPWQQLAGICNASGFSSEAIPHFSWQTAEKYRLPETHEKLAQLAREFKPFQITTSGLGVFANDHRILFIIIVKTRLLMEMHEHLWNELTPLAEECKQYYSPKNWIPHISLNLEKLSEDQFNCSFTELSRHTLQFDITVKRLGLLYKLPETSGIDSVYELGKQ
jgi:2'-5' RNA ligase